LKRATAFAPAHISGIFAVHDEAEDPLKKGSRGAGWSLELGATAVVQKAPGTTVAIRLAGDKAPFAAPVTQAALRHLAPDAGLQVELKLDLPVGQGFGMSAAGTLAACLAATSVLDLDPELALQAAHRAEVESGTGLGDAIGSWFGAGELRIKPGCPPAGWAMRIEIPEETEFVFCVVGDPIPTPNVIRDPAWKARTRELGDAAVDRILAVGRGNAWDALVDESARFGQALGLMPATMKHAAATLPTGTKWGQAMLGRTMWLATDGGSAARAEAALQGKGQVLRCQADVLGARLLR